MVHILGTRTEQLKIYLKKEFDYDKGDREYTFNLSTTVRRSINKFLHSLEKSKFLLITI